MGVCAFASGQNRHPALNREGDKMDDIYKVYFNKEMPDFNKYVDRYCVKHEITPMIACKHALVVEAYLMYLNKPITKGEEDNVRRDSDYSDDRSC